MNFLSVGKDFFGGLLNRLGNDHLVIVSAGMAFFLLLGIFPAMAAFVMLYSLIINSAELQMQLQEISFFLPADVSEFIISQVDEMSMRGETVGFGASLSILLALWSGSKASKSLIQALNIAYNEKETRGIIKISVIGYGLTLCGLFALLLAISMVVFIPFIINLLNLSGHSVILLNAYRWIFLVGLFFMTLALLYRYIPDRAPPRWRWILPGAFIATILWISASYGFSWYISRFGKYNETYGSLGTAIIFLTWLYISSFLILLGAEINQQIRRQIEAIER